MVDFSKMVNRPTLLMDIKSYLSKIGAKYQSELTSEQVIEFKKWLNDYYLVDQIIQPKLDEVEFKITNEDFGLAHNIYQKLRDILVITKYNYEDIEMIFRYIIESFASINGGTWDERRDKNSMTFSVEIYSDPYYKDEITERFKDLLIESRFYNPNQSWIVTAVDKDKQIVKINYRIQILGRL